MKMKELQDSTSILNDTERLKLRLKEDGYLYFRRFISELLVNSVRSHIVTLLHDQGWLDDKFPKEEVVCGPVVPTPSTDGTRFAALHKAIQSYEIFHKLPSATNVIDLVSRLLGEEVFCHPRKISRVTLPSRITQTVPIHQDYTYIGGTVNFLSAWIPLKDCRIQNGALRMLKGSHTTGLVKCEQIDRHPCGVIELSADDPNWYCTDYTAGDFILFPATTIHGATDNILPNIRLAMDVRFQSVNDEIAVWQTKPPFLPFTPENWNEYTENWQDKSIIQAPVPSKVLKVPEAVPLSLPNNYQAKFF